MGGGIPALWDRFHGFLLWDDADAVALPSGPFRSPMDGLAQMSRLGGMIRALARPLLASWFVYAGVRDALEPQDRAPLADPVVAPLLQEAGVTDVSTTDVVRVHGAVTALTATVLAFSRTPRTAGLALTGLAAASAAVYTPFWRLPEGPERDAMRGEFLKNLSLVGGAMLAATAGHSAGHVKRKKARKAKAKAKAASKKAQAKKHVIDAYREVPGVRGWAARRAS